MGGSSGEPLSSNNGDSSKAIDASVGRLVWVRRRNGSWWPGQIVGLDELSEGCLVSPRSGTPVKLLGREDASIDWYNLEKSKRVKDFRCGEYEDCIEKAKAAAASSGKKAVKYARREDAILHALEIESTQLRKDHSYYPAKAESFSGRIGNSITESLTISQSGGKETNVMSDDKLDGDSHSVPELALETNGSSFRVRSDRGMRRRTPNDSEDDGNAGAKRMRGLVDLGMNVVSDKKNQQEMAQQESANLHESDAGNRLSNGSLINGGRGLSSSAHKRKRSQVAHVHDFLKRRDRRRPLTKVLKSTAMVSIPVTCDQFTSTCGSPRGGLSDTTSSGIGHLKSNPSLSSAVVNGTLANAVQHASNMDDRVHDHQKMKKEPSCLPESSENVIPNTLFNVPFVSEGKKSEGFPSTLTLDSLGDHEVGVLRKQSNQSSQAEDVSFHCEPLNGSFVSTSPALGKVANDFTQSIEKSASKWQSKGKRNSRPLNNKKRRRSIGKSSICGGSNSNTFLGGLSSDLKEDLSKNADGSPLTMPDCQDKKITGVCDWGKRASPLQRGSQSRNLSGPKISSEVSLTPQRLLPYRQSRFAVHPRYETDEYPGRSSSTSLESLYDIELEVNASYRPSDVPLLSLRSILNGKAIVGHPLTVEVVDSGDCNVASLGDGLEMGSHAERSLEPIRLPSKKKKSSSRSHFSSHKKQKAKKSGSMSKKMRKLSSLTGQRKGEVDQGPLLEKPRSQVITCIPLKVVFSRINEAVNGSLRPANRVPSAV